MHTNAKTVKRKQVEHTDILRYQAFVMSTTPVSSGFYLGMKADSLYIHISLFHGELYKKWTQNPCS